MTVVKFPYEASRRIHSRKLRRSEKGTPEERAAKAAAEAAERVAAPVVPLSRASHLPVRPQPVDEIDLRRKARARLIGHNECLRAQRKEAWRKVETNFLYWRARLQLHDKIEIAQMHGAADALRHPPDESRSSMLRSFQAAGAQLLLTPAPDVASLSWKRAAFPRGAWQFIDGVKEERIERAIAEDVAFLDAHPVRQQRRTTKDGGRRP
jgi:hypothetical protein